jgi:hypothetical protein
MNSLIARSGESVDVHRFESFREGQTVEEIAERENVCPSTVRSSIQRGAARDQMLRMIELIELKIDAAIENERIRQRIREEHSQRLIKAIEVLLSGKRSVLITHPVTGKVTIQEIIDPDVIAMGIEQVIKILGLEEKPVPNPINVNIQNNQLESRMDTDLFYEDRLARIRAAQEQGLANQLRNGNDPCRYTKEPESSEDREAACKIQRSQPPM